MIGALTTHLLQSTLFAVLAGLLTLALRKNHATVRYWLWLTASLKFFVPFALLMSLGSHLGWSPVAQKMAAPQVTFAMGRIAERIAQPFPEPLLFAPATRGAVDWTLLALLALWACGCAAIGLIRLRSWRGVRAAVRASAPLQIPAAVEIRSSPGLLEPGVAGLLRPILLLPEGIAECLTPSELEAVLAHELCHVRRRDNLFASIHMMVEAIYWFHPLVWWIGARLVEERERACDESVLIMGSEPRIYAGAILNVCKLYVESPMACVPGVTGANLKRRIEAIMANRTGQSLNRTKKLLLAAAGIAALAGPVAAGMAIGAGDPPPIYAQPYALPSAPIDPPEQPAQPAPIPAANAAPQQQPATPAEVKFANHRLLVMLFDLDTMPAGDQSRARQSALEFVHSHMMPADLVAVITANRDETKVTQDFTADHAILESVLSKVSGSESNDSTASVNHRLNTIQTVANMLQPLPQKKALLYFSSGIVPTGPDDQADLQRTIAALQKGNIAIYTIDAGKPIPQTPMPSGPQAMTISPQPALSPLATYQSDRRFDGTFESFPGGHFAVEIYPAGEYQTISVPLGAYAGEVQISGQIKSLPNTPQAGAGFGGLFRASIGTYEHKVALAAGSYICTVSLKDQATGQTFEESVTFEVK